jgi:hypothetical protein
VLLLSPKFFSSPWSDSGDRCLHLGELIHGVLFIPSCPGYTGLTGASHLWDLPPVNCLTRVSLGLGAAGKFLVYLELFWLALCRVFLPCRLCFRGVFVPGPREVAEALWNSCCAPAVATGLTDSVHRSDWCHRSDRRRPSISPEQHRQQAVQVSAVRVGVFWLGRLFVGS